MALTKIKGSILSDEIYRRENNLNDVLDKAIARNNLSVYSKTESDGRYLDEAANLSDLNSVTNARTNLSVYSKAEVDSRLSNIPPSIWVGEIRRYSFDTPPAGFFALDGSRIVNGKTDFAALANSGSRFITVSGNDLILADAVDFGRGKGSSGRSVGSFEGDAIRDFRLQLKDLKGNNFYAMNGSSDTSIGEVNLPDSGNGSGDRGTTYTAPVSEVVPTAHENRPKSLTELVCIYHGVL